MKRPSTRDIIAETMLEILNSKHISEIAAAEVSRESGISVRTFYNYFSDKFDVCNYIYDSILDNHCWYNNGKRCTLYEFFDNICQMIGEDYAKFFEHTMSYKGQNSIFEHIVSRGVKDLKQQLIFTGHPELITSDAEHLMAFYMRGLASTVEFGMHNHSLRRYFLTAQDKTQYLPQSLYEALCADPVYAPCLTDASGRK